MGDAAPVAVMTMSLAPSTASMSSHGAARGAANRIGGPRGVRHRPADDRHAVHALRLHVQRGQLAHLAGADDEDVASASGRRRSCGASATAAKLTDTAPEPSAVSVRTRLPTANEAWNRRLSSGPAVCAEPADRVRFLDLTENLRFADHQRVEARRRRGTDGGRRRVRQRRYTSGCDRLAIDAVELADESHQRRPRRCDILAGDVHLGAIAGGDHGRLAAPHAASASARSALSTPRAWKSSRSRSSTGAVR